MTTECGFCHDGKVYPHDLEYVYTLERLRASKAQGRTEICPYCKGTLVPGGAVAS